MDINNRLQLRDVFTNMETNNVFKRWHNQLKTYYFNSRRNRRVDTLIAVLVNDVDFDMQANRQVKSYNIGRFKVQYPVQQMEHARPERPPGICDSMWQALQSEKPLTDIDKYLDTAPVH